MGSSLAGGKARPIQFSASIGHTMGFGALPCSGERNTADAVAGDNQLVMRRTLDEKDRASTVEPNQRHANVKQRVYTTSALARRLGVSRQTLYNWIATGKIKPPSIVNGVRLWTNSDAKEIMRVKPRNYPRQNKSEHPRTWMPRFR